MPYSSELGKKIIVKWLSQKRPDLQCMIDFGVGAGYFGKLFKKLQPQCSRFGVEIFEPYIQKFGLFRIYQQIFVENASKMVLPDADIAIFGDVLEHLTKDVALDFIKRIDAKYRHIIVSIPIGSYPQGAVGGNEFERHLSEWSFDDLCEVFKNFKIQSSFKNIAVFIKQL